MQIDLKKIPQEGLNIKEQEPADIMAVKEKDVEFAVPVNISVSVNLISGTLLVRGTVQTKVGLVCSRCLKRFQQHIENDDFNFDLDVKELTEVDITDNIREGIIILLPIKPLCKSDCKGICHRCGQDLNEKNCGCDRKPEDIRWKELDKINIRAKDQ